MSYFFIFILLFGLIFGFQSVFIIILMLIFFQILGVLIGFSPILLLIGAIYIIYKGLNRSDKNKPKFERRFYYYNFNDQNNSNHYQRTDINKRKYEDYSKYYKILGVSVDDDFETVRKAYRNLARQYHPDLHQTKNKLEQEDYNKKFQEINHAFNKIKEKKT